MRLRAILIFFGLSLAGCSFQADYEASKTATENFHHQVDRREYIAIYDGSAPDFQQSTSRDNTVGFLARISRKMGDCGNFPVTVGGYQATTSGTFVTVNASRKCANGTLEEQFVWVMKADRPRLLKYNANSPLLLTD